MATDWNELAGELRSALAARDWHQAGAVVWQLRQLDDERFTLELEHYTNEQVRKGGYGMALETEQRLQAVREWVENLTTEDKGRLSGLMVRGFSSTSAFPPTDLGGLDITILDWEIINLAINPHGSQVPQWQVRQDMRDVIWLALRS